MVSIPIGFSHQLRRRGNRDLMVTAISFNPYRVFSSAETHRQVALPHVGRRFNPYRVFSSAETGINSPKSNGSVVSIPIGFSHQLRRFRP